MEPADYAETLALLKRQVHEARFTVQRRANSEMLRLYWRIGHTILARQRVETWGSGVLARLAADLRTEFPSMKGFSLANLAYMRGYADCWKEDAILQQAVGELPWSHIVSLLDKLDETPVRDWYAAQDLLHGWSRAVLEHQIASRLHDREGAAQSNFVTALETADSELAQQITKDPNALDFLAIDSDATERELEDQLTSRIIETLRELGVGFAFVGRQVHFDIEGGFVTPRSTGRQWGSSSSQTRRTRSCDMPWAVPLNRWRSPDMSSQPLTLTLCPPKMF
ncbi:PDDEXK nuclease domain-containing protein [Subtercola sp. Z020]|uniref:PDDEXK nuclease domain-containing protein n=1 Tax=Subtercola sp. Z020 TaxID=2080582 RepID=UPI001E2C83B7|nr:PDDEXK nuclease domain-containing protein [Subtercola sp. Z020]